MRNIIELITEYFKFLINEYNYSIVSEEHNPEVMGNAVVILKSKFTGVIIIFDRGQISIKIGEASTPEEEWFDIGDVVKTFYPNLPEVYEFTTASTNYQDYIEFQLKKLADILQDYCLQLIIGDFSMKGKIKETETARVSKMLKRFKNISKDEKF